MMNPNHSGDLSRIQLPGGVGVAAPSPEHAELIMIRLFLDALLRLQMGHTPEEVCRDLDLNVRRKVPDEGAV